MPQVCSCNVHQGEPLFGCRFLDDASLRYFGHQGTCGALRVFGKQQGDGLAIRRPSRSSQKPLNLGELPGRATGGVGYVELLLAAFRRIGKKRQPLAVGRPRDRTLIVSCCSVPGSDAPRRCSRMSARPRPLAGHPEKPQHHRNLSPKTGCVTFRPKALAGCSSSGPSPPAGAEITQEQST